MSLGGGESNVHIESRLTASSPLEINTVSMNHEFTHQGTQFL